jgi:uncharacterized membrane protein YcfT
MTRTRVFEAVRYCGANTLPVYLAFFLFMAATRVVLLKTGIITDGGVISLIVTAAGVIGPLVLHWIALRTPARFLFVRPGFARLTGKRRSACCRVVVSRPSEACVNRRFRCWCEAGAGGIVPPP